MLLLYNLFRGTVSPWVLWMASCIINRTLPVVQQLRKAFKNLNGINTCTISTVLAWTLYSFWLNFTVHIIHNGCVLSYTDNSSISHATLMQLWQKTPCKLKLNICVFFTCVTWSIGFENYKKTPSGVTMCHQTKLCKHQLNFEIETNSSVLLCSNG